MYMYIKIVQCGEVIVYNSYVEKTNSSDRDVTT